MRFTTRVAPKVLASLMASLVASIAMAAACHSAAAQSVRVGIVNSSTDVPFFIADAKGYFKDEGLSVELLPFDAGAKMIAFLGTGDLDVGGGAPSVALYNAAAQGVAIRIIADKAHHAAGLGHAALMVRKDLIDRHQFMDYKDLKGRKVAVVGVGSGDESVLNEALKRGGLKWGDANVVYMGFPQHPAAFQNGAIDASLTSEPFFTVIKKAGSAVAFARNGEIYPDQQSTVLMYGVGFAKKAELATKFTRAYIRAARFYNDAIAGGSLSGPNAAEVVAILVKYSVTKDPEIHKAVIPPAIDPDGKLNVASLRKDWQFFKDSGQIDGKVTVDSLLDTGFVDTALKSLGRYVPGSSR
jgi:NitT/TauT family transport system substrate-binding protein